MNEWLPLTIILAHLVGDYLFQSHWMATEKTTKWWPAIAHGLGYTLAYALLVTLNPWALLIIGGTHVIIDRYRLAKHLGWLKNQIGPKRTRPSFSETMANGGYSKETPVWLANFLLFVTDNTVHLLINFAAVLIFVV